MKLILPALIELEVPEGYDVKNKAPLISECIHRNLVREPAGEGVEVIDVKVAIPWGTVQDLQRATDFIKEEA